METTLNIHREIFNQITEAAQVRSISCSEMISYLLKEVIGETSEHGRLGSTVRYQKRHHPCDWHKFHAKVEEDMYEYWQDLRRLLKRSVSLILALAVKKYLSKLMKEKNADNYRFTYYLIKKKVVNNAIIWKFIWGLPPGH